MSNRRNYTIETALSSSTEWGVTQAPFSLSPFHSRIRRSCVPYFAGPTTALDENLRSNDCWLPATQPIALLHISSDSEIFAPNLDYNQELTLAHIASTSQVYDPDIDSDQAITLEHIASTSQIYDPNLDSDLSFTLEHIASTSQVYTPDLDINQEITLNHIVSTSQIYDPDVSPVQPINLEHIASTSQVYTPDIDFNQEATLEHIASTSAIYDPNIVYDQEATLEHIVSTSQVYDPDITYAQEATLEHVASTSQVYTPDLDINQEVTLEYIASTSQVYTPDLDINQEVTLEYIASTSQVYDPDIDSDQAITLEHIASTSAIYDPNIEFNQEVTLDHLASTSQVYDPNLIAGQAVTLEHIASTSTIYDPNIDYNQEVTLEHITSTSQVYDPNVLAGQTVTLEHIASTSTIYDPNIDYNQEVTLEHIVSTSQVYTPDIDYNQTTTLEHIVSTSTIYDPNIDYDQEVTLEHIASTSQIYTPDVSSVQEVTLNHITSQFANNKSIAFNGVSGESQLTVPDSDSLSFGADGTIGNEPSFTWSAWIKPTTLGMSPFGIVSKILTGGTGDEYFFGYVPLVGLTFLIADGDGFGGDYIAQAGVTINTDEWQHVCATYDGSRVPGGMKIYLNGVDASTTGLSPGSYTAMSNSSADLVIGRRWSGLTTNVSDGFIDEVAAFDKELSSAEVSELYNSGDALNLNTFSAASDIVSWWRMGDTTIGTSPDYTIPDAIGSNNGTMSSFQGNSTSGVVADAVPAPSQAYTPNLDYDHEVTLGFVSSTSQVYVPDINYNQEVTLSHIASTSQAYTPNIDYDQSITLLLIDSTITLYNPTISVAPVTTANSYTQILSASNPANSSSMHVGSLWLDAQTYTTMGALINDIYLDVGGSNVHTELRRFTNGSSLITLTAENTAGNPFQYITASSVVVSTSDWYDIYISASGNPATSSIRGIYYEY